MIVAELFNKVNALKADADMLADCRKKITQRMDQHPLFNGAPVIIAINECLENIYLELVQLEKEFIHHSK